MVELLSLTPQDQLLIKYLTEQITTRRITLRQQQDFALQLSLATQTKKLNELDCGLVSLLSV